MPAAPTVFSLAMWKGVELGRPGHRRRASARRASAAGGAPGGAPPARDGHRHRAQRRARSGREHRVVEGPAAGALRGSAAVACSTVTSCPAVGRPRACCASTGSGLLPDYRQANRVEVVAPACQDLRRLSHTRTPPATGNAAAADTTPAPGRHRRATHPDKDRDEPLRTFGRLPTTAQRSWRNRRCAGSCHRRP